MTTDQGHELLVDISVSLFRAKFKGPQEKDPWVFPVVIVEIRNNNERECSYLFEVFVCQTSRILSLLKVFGMQLSLQCPLQL